MSVYDIILVLGVVLPLLAGLYLFLFGWAFGRQRWLYQSSLFGTAVGALVCQGALAYGIARGTRTPYANLFRWSPLPDFEIALELRGDLLSLFFTLPLAILTLLLVLYLMMRRPGSERSEGIERGRLFGLMFMAEGAALAAFYSANLVMIYAWIEVLGLVFYLLAGPGLHGVMSTKVAYQSYSASIVGGFLVLAPLLVIISRNGGVARYDQLSLATVDTLLFGFVVGGMLIKAAQFPFQMLFGSITNLPAAAHILVGVGTILPLAIYLPARLQSVVVDRIDLFRSLDWLFFFAGSLTVFVAGWLALREALPVRRTAYLVAGSFGFVVIALGLGDLPAALLQWLGLSLGAPLLFMATDIMQVENAPAPHNFKNAARSNPVRRPLSFRAILAIFYIIGAAGVVGLPLSPAYAARWQTLSELAGAGQRFYFGLALVGLGLMALGLIHAFALFLQAPQHTEEHTTKASVWPLFIPSLLAVASIALAFAPTLALDWLESLTTRVPIAGPSRLPNALFGPGSVFGLLALLALALGAIVVWRGGKKMQTAPAFNGGMLFGAEAEAERLLRLSRSKALVVPQEAEAFGFEDEFFKTGLRDMAPPPPKVEVHLSADEYFGPLMVRLREAFKLPDTSFSGGLFARILLKVLDFIRRFFEWLTERFYPALAAFIVLLFIFLMTR